MISAQIHSWSIDISSKPKTFRCESKTFPVEAANNCPAAIASARKVLESARSCLCGSGRTLIQWDPVCKRGAFNPSKESYLFNISMAYSCEKKPSGDTRSNCDEAAEMKDGRPVLPPDATDIEGPEYVDEDRGFLSDLYPGRDTTTDGFYPLPCEASIGGSLPPEAMEPLSEAESEAEEFISKFELSEGPKIIEELKLELMSKLPKFNDFEMGPCFIGETRDPQTGQTARKEVRCDDTRFLRSGQPFEGRDIIYVHGLATGQLKKWILGDEEAHKLWPLDSSEFLDSNGYFRQYAEDYWKDHIHEHLFDPNDPPSSLAGWQWTASDPAPRYNPKSNRYLLVSWSSNQTIEFAQHALLEQIRLAITANKNVVTPPSYPSTHARPFCANGCIIISHSTGGLIVSSAMALARAGSFGPGGIRIPKYIRAHVAFEGAISGSRLASVGMAIGLASSSPVPNSLCLLYDNLLDLTDTCLRNTSFVGHSIFRDLIPAVAQGVWGKILAFSPVPTVTVAGGHPTGDFFSATKIFLPGFDDGVVSMNSACGNPNPVFPHILAPSGIIVTSNLKAFEMTQDPGLFARSVKNFISHNNLMGGMVPGVRYLAGTCTPYLSPTGMVMPVESPLIATPWYTRARYPNHYSLIQGSIDHAYDGGSYPQNKWPSAMANPASTDRHYWQMLGPNIEESSAITDKGIFKKFSDGTYLVHPSFANMHEIVRGRKITFRLFKKKRIIWIWKRTYHLLDKWEQKQSSHYVYEFVGRR
jgi:hypothetical protein